MPTVGAVHEATSDGFRHMKQIVKSLTGALGSAKLLRTMALLLAFALAMVSSAYAGTDATEIITDATSAFTSVATLCVAIGSFFIIYKIVKKVR